MKALLFASVFAVLAVPAYGQSAVKPALVERLPDIVIVRHGQGGRLDDHNRRYTDYRNSKTKVELRGPCYSACTLITAYVAKADLCIAQGAFLAFHAVRSAETGKLMPVETVKMVLQQPPDIVAWIARMGGTDNLPLDGYWTMYDRELWAMGYPRCAP